MKLYQAMPSLQMFCGRSVFHCKTLYSVYIISPVLFYFMKKKVFAYQICNYLNKNTVKQHVVKYYYNLMFFVLLYFKYNVFL